MAAENDREAFTEAMKSKDFSKIRELLQRDDANELLLMKGDKGYLPIHEACRWKLDESIFQLMIDVAIEHGIIKQMLEEKDQYGRTCLQLATLNQVSTDTLRLLLEFLSKYADIKKMLEEKCNTGWTCLHHACYAKLSTNSLRLLLEYSSKYADIKKILLEEDGLRRNCLHKAFYGDVPTDFLRLLISFFPSKELLAAVLRALLKNDNDDDAPNHLAKPSDDIKKLLQDPDCWRKSRAWLLQNHEETFLYSLYPSFVDKTCQALQEVSKGSSGSLQYTSEHGTIVLIALMSSPSKFREAIDKTDSSARMSSYFAVVKKGDRKSDYHCWRKNINRFREFYGHWPPSERKTKTSFEGEGRSSCVIQ